VAGPHEPAAPAAPLAFDFGAVVEATDLSNRQAVNTCDGLFLVEDCLRTFVAKCYARVKQTTTGGIPTFDDFRRDIESRAGDEMFYLHEETRCRVGYIFEGVSVGRLRMSPVRPMSCSDTLLPADPIFKHGGSKLCDNGDIEVNCQGAVYRVTKHAFACFREGIREAQEFDGKRSHRRPCAPREAFLRLAGRLNRSRALECRSAEIRERFKNATFRGTGQWIFVVEKNDIVTTCLWLRKVPYSVFKPYDETTARSSGMPAAGGDSATRR